MKKISISILAAAAAAALLLVAPLPANANAVYTGNRNCPSSYDKQISTSTGTVSHYIYSNVQWGQYSMSYPNTSTITTRTSKWNGSSGYVLIQDGTSTYASGTNVVSAGLSCG